MLALGQIKPWQKALETFTAKREWMRSALADYFAPREIGGWQQNKAHNYRGRLVAAFAIQWV